jgi:exocyst complex component 4
VPTLARQFIFVGLGNLIDQMLILNARFLKLPTPSGIKKITRNMLALQQSVKSITEDPESSEFTHAKRYFALFFMTPQVDRIRSGLDSTHRLTGYAGWSPEATDVYFR